MSYNYICRVCESKVVPVYCGTHKVFNCNNCGTISEEDVTRRKNGDQI